MCGICGLINSSGVELTTVVGMNQVASHRGPDGEGYWLWDGESATGQFIGKEGAKQKTSRGSIGLGHRRLAILDLSDAGLQPMPSKDKRVWIVFNGEIYNYLELKDELIQQGHRFHTRTDTEVILAAYDQWGTDCFARFNGMWAVAIVDLRRRQVVFSRDRLGIRPLYIWAKNQALAFASEIKQFYALADFKPVANMDALIEYIDTGYQLPSTTFFRGVQEFPSGCWAEVPIDEPGYPLPQPFWFPESLVVSKISRIEAREQIRSLFEDSVKLRLRSDVPVGVCLSGGLDSSSIFCQMQQFKKKDSSPTYAFSAVFDDVRFDERKYIKIVLKESGGKWYYTFPGPKAFLNDFDSFLFHLDEPPGSLTQYCEWSVMRLAQEHHVPVLLSGQGGDELFSGYWPAYYFFLRQQKIHFIWRVAEHMIGALLPGGNPALVFELPAHLHRYQYRKSRRGRSLLMPRWSSAGFTLKENWAIIAQQLSPVQYRIYEMRRIYLPRFLKWDDRSSMAFGIEARCPFLDYRLVELALTLAPEMNMRRGWNKLLFREALGHILPPAIQWRKSKVGFEVPQSEWIRTTLRPVLAHWAAYPSEQLQQVVDKVSLKQLADELIGSRALHKMDERQHLLIRLFLLDRWLNLFKVSLPDAGVEPSLANAGFRMTPSKIKGLSDGPVSSLKSEKVNIRVLMITSEWPSPQNPGRGAFIVQRVDYLRKAGVDVELFSYYGKMNPINYLKAWFKLRRLYNIEQFDIVDAQFGEDGLIALPTKAPIVATFRGSDLLGIFGAADRYTMAGVLLRHISRYIARRAKEVIVVSERLTKHLPSKVSAHIIPSGVDLGLFYPMPQPEARKRLNLALDKYLVLFVGFPDDLIKRYHLAQQAVELLKSEFNVDLVMLCGKPHRLVPVYMNACDVLVVTSKHEGSPNAVKEALACNLPVVSVDVGDVGQRIGGVEGCVVLPDDSPQTIAKGLTQVLKKRSRICGRDTVAELDWPRVAQRIIEVYRSVLVKDKLR